MKTGFAFFVIGLTAVIAVAFFLAASARAEQSATSPFTVLSTSVAPLGLMLVKGGVHGSHMHYAHSAHFHHGHHGYYRHGRFYGDGGGDYGGDSVCWSWNGYKYVWVCPTDDE